jgi:hypothetical protein
VKRKHSTPTMTGVNSWHTNDEFNKNGNKKKNYQKEAFVKGELQRIMTITEDVDDTTRHDDSSVI